MGVEEDGAVEFLADHFGEFDCGDSERVRRAEVVLIEGRGGFAAYGG